jgi:hypothetical protein
LEKSQVKEEKELQQKNEEQQERESTNADGDDNDNQEILTVRIPTELAAAEEESNRSTHNVFPNIYAMLAVNNFQLSHYLVIFWVKN